MSDPTPIVTATKKTAGTFDDKLMLLEPAADLTATATGQAVDFNGDDMDELNIRAIIPNCSGTSPKLVLKYQGSDDLQVWHDLYIFPDITAVGEYSHKMRGKGRYRRVVATVTGTTPNLGKVKVGISTGGVFEW